MGGGVPLLARWTTDFDCGYETNWWYCICDRPYDIGSVKSDLRYKINKGLKHFEIKLENPLLYVGELLNVYNEAQKSYPIKNQNFLQRDNFEKYLKRICSGNIKFYIAFYKETGEVVGYIVVHLYSNYAELQSQKANPKFEKYQLNAAMVYTILFDYKEELSNGCYINDGSRNINHDTHFQDYLERYFGFRKAYCKLHIKYRWFFGIIIHMLYPFGRIFKKYDSLTIVHKINAILLMEKIRREEINE